MILLMLCSGRDIITIIEFFRVPPKAGQFSLVPDWAPLRRLGAITGHTKEIIIC